MPPYYSVLDFDLMAKYVTHLKNKKNSMSQLLLVSIIQLVLFPYVLLKQEIYVQNRKIKKLLIMKKIFSTNGSQPYGKKN